jgi:hypothetical protein
MPTSRLFSLNIHAANVFRVNLRSKITRFEAEPIPSSATALVNYGARRRRGEPISTAFVESAANEIIAKRMVKKQQMRWNRWTGPPFLDVRVAVPHGTLGKSPRGIYPSFRPVNDTYPETAAA